MGEAIAWGISGTTTMTQVLSGMILEVVGEFGVLVGVWVGVITSMFLRTYYTFPMPTSYARGGVGWGGWGNNVLLLRTLCMLRFDGFSCVSCRISSYGKISGSLCYVTRTSLDFMPRYATLRWNSSL